MPIIDLISYANTFFLQSGRSGPQVWWKMIFFNIPITVLLKPNFNEPQNWSMLLWIKMWWWKIVFMLWNKYRKYDNGFAGLPCKTKLTKSADKKTAAFSFKAIEVASLRSPSFAGKGHACFASHQPRISSFSSRCLSLLRMMKV